MFRLGEANLAASMAVRGRPVGYLTALPKHAVAKALVGTEGTCAVVARATVRLVRPPAIRALLVLGFDDDGLTTAAILATTGLTWYLPV